MKCPAIKAFLIGLMVALGLYLFLNQGNPVHAQSAEGPHGYKYISAAGTTPVRNGPGYLNIVSINGGSTGAVTLYDISSDGCSGTPASGKFATILAVTVPTPLFYDLTLKSGLCVVTAANTDVTVVFN